MVDRTRDASGNLAWATKVTLCEQGRATENRILQSYRTIFIALETILFTTVFTVLWDCRLGVIIVFILGLLLTFLWWHICDLRGDAVDRWEEVLADLWKKAKDPDLAKLKSANYYQGAVKRREKRLEGERTGGRIGGQIAVSKGWGGWRRFISARWVFTTVMPSLVTLGWIIVLIKRFCDC
jgi:hypothetical protein